MPESTAFATMHRRRSHLVGLFQLWKSIRGAVVAVSSSTSGEARGRRTGATAGNASTKAPTTSRMAHLSLENPLELLHEMTEVAGKGGFGIERNGTSHLTLHVSCVIVVKTKSLN
uniref:Uncharacterized protein n=1 Tax=Oryza punctata TaxID=4537 RepID=A0A0E0LI34_ORYPU